MPTVLVLGAHTALARAIAECVEERDLELELVMATTSEHLGPGLVPIDEASLQRADLWLVAAAGPVAAGLVEAARRLGKPVIDLVDLGAPGARALWPGLAPSDGGALVPGAVHTVATGLALPVLSALRALWLFGLARVEVVALESAAAFDQPGMDELEAQVRAVLGLRDVEVSALPGALAFDVVPSLADGQGDDFAAADARLAGQLRAGLSTLGERLPAIGVTRVLVPTFTADAAVLVVDLEDTPDRAAVEDALRAGRGLFLDGEPAPGARAAVGRDDTVVGRLEVEGRTVRLWVAADRLRRGSATLAALVLERWLAARKLN